MRLLKKSAIWIVLLLYIILAFGFVKNRYKEQQCSFLNVRIIDSVTNEFINREDVMKILADKGIDYLGMPLDKVDLGAIENAVSSNQIVGHCKAFLGVKGVLTIEIRQRDPLIRIMEQDGKGYYLDKEGNVINLSTSSGAMPCASANTGTMIGDISGKASMGRC